jgi:protein-arginine kinase activator protein McsA
MGIEFKIINTEKREVDKIVCDRCSIEIEKLTEGGWNQFGDSFTVYHEPAFVSYFELNVGWGYDSKKDGEIHKAVLCEECYDEVFKDVKIHKTSFFGDVPDHDTSDL